MPQGLSPPHFKIVPDYRKYVYGGMVQCYKHYNVKGKKAR